MTAPLRWKLIGGFVLVFIAGLLAGAFLGAAQSRHHRMDFAHHGPLTERIRSRMRERLDLTAAQIEKTAPILDKTARELERIRLETERHIHDVLINSEQALAADLTPEQRERMKKLEAKNDPDRSRRRSPP